MKYPLLILLVSITYLVNAQINTRTYLLYERINGQSLNDSTGEMLKELTQFMVRGLLTLTDTRAYTRDINILNNQDEKKINWELHSSGINIKISNQDVHLNGRILTNSFVDNDLFNDKEVQFLLLPIETGITNKILNGKYIKTGMNQSDTIVFRDIIDNGEYKGLQRTSFIWNKDHHSGTAYGLTKYMNLKYNNLIYVGAMNQFLQPTTVDSDNIITYNLFLAQFEIAETIIKSVIKLDQVK